MIATIVFSFLPLLLANAQQIGKIDCDFTNPNCQHGYVQRVKILQMFERVWSQCPVVSALDRNIGYLERGWDVARVMREHVRGNQWPQKYIDGKSSDQKVPPLYDVYLARNPSAAEISQNSGLISMTNDYKTAENSIADSPESFDRFRKYNIVPGCGRAGVNCTQILDSITQSYCRLYHQCPDTNAYLEQSPFYGTGELASPMMIHRHYMHSIQYEQTHMKGKSSPQKVAQLYRHLLNREVTPSDNVNGLIATTDLDYRGSVVQIQNSPEYQSKFGKWVVPGNDANGQDINPVGLSFQPPCH